MEKQEALNPQNGKQRWSILLGGFFLSLVGGMSYSWGSFVVPLVNDWGWTAATATLPLTVLILVFAVTMIPAGWLQDRFGPRKVSAAGSGLFFIGYGMAACIRFIPTHSWLIVSYGVVVGVACGLTYSCIAPTARKWYPDRPGFAVSTAVMGFGLAAVLFAPLKKIMISRFGVDGTLFILGIFVFTVSMIGSRLLRNPEPGWAPAQNPKAFKNSTETRDIPPQEFVKTREFPALWFALALVIGGGLTAIGLLTPFGELELKLSPTEAALSVSMFSLINGLGRPFAGWMGDRFGPVRVMIAVYCMQALVFLTMPLIATSFFMLLVCAFFLGAGYAVTFALFPVIVAEGFGSKYLGINYGLVFSAFGVGAITGLVGSILLDKTGSFTPAFLLAGTSTLVGLFILNLLRKRLK